MAHLTKNLTLYPLLCAFLSVCLWRTAQAEESVTFNVSDPSESTPTRCLASGRSCVGEQSISNGLVVNPAALASPAKIAVSAWHLNVGNISESLFVRPQEKLTVTSNDGSIGWASGWGSAGIGIIANLKTTTTTYKVSQTAESSDTARTNSRFGSVAIQGGVRLGESLAFGLSYARFGLIHDFSVNQQSADMKLPKLENSYYGNAPTFGLLIGSTKNTSIGLVHRPQVQLSHSGDNLRTGGDAQRREHESIRSARQAYQQVSANGFQSAKILMPAKTTLGFETVLYGSRTLVFRSDIEVLSPIAGSFRMDPNYLSYLAQESDLKPSTQKYQVMPGAGLTAKLPSFLFFSELAVGTYYDETRADTFLGEVHQTYGLSKDYQLMGWDFSLDVAVDQTRHGRRYLINLF